MAELEILQIGNPVLRKRSLPIVRFDDKLLQLADDMVETMHSENGVGLAAPQVGVLSRLIVVEMPDDENYPNPGERFILCNPKIVKHSRETDIDQEGCLSVRGYVGLVERPIAVIVDAQNLHGKNVRIKAKDYFARALQHEMDHLNGVLYVDIAEAESVISLEELEQEEEAAVTE